MHPLLALLLLTPTSMADPKADLAKAERFLDGGQERMALEHYQDILATRPGSGRVQLGYARALGGTGDCVQALPILVTLRGKPVWGADGAYAEGQCRLRMGDITGAQAAFAEATWFRPFDSDAWMYLASVSSRLGDESTFAEAIEELEALPGAAHVAAMVAAERSLDIGDTEAFEADLRALAAVAGNEGPVYHLLDARRWLDLDDADTAVAVLMAALRQTPASFQLALWHSEAIRRTGDPSTARAALARPKIQRQTDGALALAFEIRLLVDEGRLDEAAAALARHPDPANDEVVASGWYLARARGDVAEMNRLAATWRAFVHASDRRLEQLVPLHDREQP